MDHLRGKWGIDVARAVRGGAFVVLAALLMFSCTPGSSRYTIEWLPDGDGFVQFLTNEQQYLDTIQYLPLAGEFENPMITVTATAKKMSGAGLIGFGIVFCYQDEDNHYILLITAGGDYMVGKNVGGTFTALVPWTSSAELTKGWGMPNDISITRTGPGHFDVTFNTHFITDFDDSDFPGGKAGPCIGIGSYDHERFPGVPEDARFQMTLPVIYP